METLIITQTLISTAFILGLIVIGFNHYCRYLVNRQRERDKSKTLEGYLSQVMNLAPMIVQLFGGGTSPAGSTQPLGRPCNCHDEDREIDDEDYLQDLMNDEIYHSDLFSNWGGREPKCGEMVIYVDENLKSEAGVVWCFGPGPSQIHLTLLNPHEIKTRVPYSAEPKPNTWHWPTDANTAAPETLNMKPETKEPITDFEGPTKL